MGIKTSVFHIHHQADLENVWQNLEDAGCSLLYSDDNEQSKQIYGHLAGGMLKEQLCSQYPEILSIEAIELPDIDWEAQWAAHDTYHDGYLHVNLNEYDKESSTQLKLIPGPGFGDHSHPTTRLVLKLMPKLVKNSCIIDVGCGSGILSLAAVSLGARAVHGIDIDADALIHSLQNAVVNEMDHIIKFYLPEELKVVDTDSIVLMNMIQSEQEMAWASLGRLTHQVSFVVTSGVLKEEREDYVRRWLDRGWNLVEEQEESGWLGFMFKSL
jgi:ribosomal protein L11 methyltransferase